MARRRAGSIAGTNMAGYQALNTLHITTTGKRIENFVLLFSLTFWHTCLYCETQKVSNKYKHISAASYYVWCIHKSKCEVPYWFTSNTMLSFSIVQPCPVTGVTGQ